MGTSPFGPGTLRSATDAISALPAVMLICAYASRSASGVCSSSGTSGTAASRSRMVWTSAVTGMTWLPPDGADEAVILARTGLRRRLLGAVEQSLHHPAGTAGHAAVVLPQRGGGGVERTGEVGQVGRPLGQRVRRR